jgi:hypothetical protein
MLREQSRGFPWYFGIHRASGSPLFLILPCFSKTECYLGADPAWQETIFPGSARYRYDDSPDQ